MTVYYIGNSIILGTESYPRAINYCSFVRSIYTVVSSSMNVGLLVGYVHVFIGNTTKIYLTFYVVHEVTG